FPKVVEAFAPGTVDAAQRDLAELTLGPGSARITRVVPAESRLDVGILLSKKEPVAAVARTAFGADATVRGGGSVRVSHGGTYFLRMIDGTWKIVGYDVDGSIESVDPQAGPTPTGSAG
ncbi:MAG TPA: hypothetical protein VM638_05635, partial [Actinomycetota bacterium]|nr:hypothetical protein [Actinomycetota bacterium]